MDETPAKPDQPTTVKSPRRRWYQFTLRTLLIFVTLAGCGFGWLGLKIREARQQAAAVAAIQMLGGYVHYDFEYDPQGDDVPDANPPGPAWLHSLLGDDFFADVHSVSLDATHATDAEFGRLRLQRLTKLQVLVLDDTQLTDASLEHLEGLSKLKRLNLAGTRVTNAGLKRLHELPHLAILVLSGTQVTDAGLENLDGLHRLAVLYLDGTQVTDAGLEHLKGLTELRVLGLHGTRVTDDGLQYLKGMTQLEWLFLGGAHVTDAGLEHLKSLTRLLELFISGTQITDAGVANLQRALPKCDIRRVGSNGR